MWWYKRVVTSAQYTMIDFPNTTRYLLNITHFSNFLGTPMWWCKRVVTHYLLSANYYYDLGYPLM